MVLIRYAPVCICMKARFLMIRLVCHLGCITVEKIGDGNHKGSKHLQHGLSYRCNSFIVDLRHNLPLKI